MYIETRESIPLFTRRRRRAAEHTGSLMKSRKIENSSEMNLTKEVFQTKKATRSTSMPLKREGAKLSTYNDSKTVNTASSRGMKQGATHPKNYLRVAAQSIRNGKRVFSEKSFRGKPKRSKASSKPRLKKFGSRKSRTKRSRKGETKENTKKKNTSKPLRYKEKKKVKEKKASKKAAANYSRKKASRQFTLSFLNLKINDQGQLVNAAAQEEKRTNEIDIPEQNLQMKFSCEDEENLMEIESSLENLKDTHGNTEIHASNYLEQHHREVTELPPFLNLNVDDERQLVNSNNQQKKITDGIITLPQEEQNRQNFIESEEEANIMETESLHENSEQYSKDADVDTEIQKMHLEQRHQELSPFGLNLCSTFMERANKVLNTKTEDNWKEINAPNIKNVSKSFNEAVNNRNLRLQDNCSNDHLEAVAGSESINNLSTNLDYTSRIMDTTADKPFNEMKGNKRKVLDSSNERVSNGNSRPYIRHININQSITSSESTLNLSIYAQNASDEMYTGNVTSLIDDERLRSEGKCDANPEILKFLESISLTDQENLRSIPIFSEIIPKTQEASTRNIFTEISVQNNSSLENIPGSANVPNQEANPNAHINNNEVSERYIQTVFSMLPFALPSLFRFVYYTFGN